MAGTYPISDFTLGTGDQKIPVGNRIPLILAQGTSSGSFTSGALVENIANDFGTAAALCGAGSIAQIMIDTFKALNKGRLDAIIVSDNGSGVAASTTLVFTASTPAAGTMHISIGSYVNNRYEIPVTTSSTATTLGDALVAAIAADTYAPITASNSSGTVTLTAKSKGTEGNKIGQRVEGIPTGVTVTLTAFSSGATDPSLSGVLTKIDEKRYDIITELAFLSTVKTHLEAKFNSSNAILDGIAYVTNTDTYANLQTALAPATLASQVIQYTCNKKVADSDFKGPALLELDYAVSSTMGALRSLRLTNGAILNPFMVGNNNRGGAFTAGLPYQNMRLNNLTTIPTGKGFTQTEMVALGNLGGSTMSMDSGGVVAVTNPFWLTCYKAATPTAIGLTYRTVNKNDCATIAREYIFTNMKNTFAQAALTAGSIPAYVQILIANEKSIRAYIVGLWQDLWQDPAYTVLQGDTSILQDEFNRNLQVNIDTASGAVTGSMVINLMGQLTSFSFDITPNL